MTHGSLILGEKGILSGTRIIRPTVLLGDVLAPATWENVGTADLVFGSPPYEDARTYGIGFTLKGQAWVDWMVEVVKISLAHCRGLVAFVVEGRTRQFRWSATPALLMADLHRAGIHLRKPPIYRRVGIPGSGGPDWLRSDTEWIVCATNGGKLPWSDNVACGLPCKFAPGGAMSNRTVDGQRRNKKTGTRLNIVAKDQNQRHKERARMYVPPERANPGNIIDCGAVGGGNMGSDLCHENEAPFPETMANFFVRSFCPPDGLVIDPFSGSGTTGAAAIKAGRNFIGFDIRQSQVDLSNRRLLEAQDQIARAASPTTTATASAPKGGLFQ